MTQFFEVGSNCAIAVAVRDIFPLAWVKTVAIYPFYDGLKANNNHAIEMPSSARQFIKAFDDLSIDYERRLDLPEFSFEIEIPESIIDQINIEDIHKSATLELVN